MTVIAFMDDIYLFICIDYKYILKSFIIFVIYSFIQYRTQLSDSYSPFFASLIYPAIPLQSFDDYVVCVPDPVLYTPFT